METTTKDFNVVNFYETKNYELFNFLPFNRDVANAHVKEITKSIKQHGFKGVIQVIKTSIFDSENKMYILDGQHRFMAAKELNLPIKFELTEFTERKAAIEFITELNNSQKKWNTNQYLDIWSGLGIREYIKLSDVVRETKIQISALLEAYTFTGQVTDFRKGLIKFPNEALSDKTISQLMDLNEFLPHKAYCRRTILRLMRQEKYNHEKMKIAVAKYHDLMGGFSENELELNQQFQALIDNCHK